eukprot:3521266-Rhodomonas_salina.2
MPRSDEADLHYAMMIRAASDSLACPGLSLQHLLCHPPLASTRGFRLLPHDFQGPHRGAMHGTLL